MADRRSSNSGPAIAGAAETTGLGAVLWAVTPSPDARPAAAVTPAAVPRRAAKIRPWRWRPAYPPE
ncbi:hypothetical protein ACIA5D_47120 [Actinoplanes sp. NPDC051513]|uniref:hypothetical protein n=1 Tax=Actinoplanes sp. NPDC051513 TaxID=3363908 RepID=UPI00379878D8